MSNKTCFFLIVTVKTTYKLTKKVMIFIPWHVSFSTEIFSLDGPKIQPLNFNTMKYDLNIYYIMQKIHHVKL